VRGLADSHSPRQDWEEVLGFLREEMMESLETVLWWAGEVEGIELMGAGVSVVGHR